MTDPENYGEWTEVHALSGAYAVDALDDLERARFEDHLSRCAECRAEVDSLREAAAVLSVDDVEPPAALRASVLAGIEEIRPLPPLTHQTVPVTTLRRRRPVWRSLPLQVAAALVLVALATTAVLRPWHDDAPAPLTADQVLQAADVQSVGQQLPDGSAATVYVSRSKGAAVVRTHDMALAPAGKTYELWLQTPEGDMEPAGLMPDDPDATVLLHGDASDSTAVGITVEPDGGSDQPTTEPVLLFDLTT
ncbi:anti-sigma factor domain-containing protein [Nocardioides sp. MH1]|uniref:anti-sigma factor n=1 Tax=Nocardioides sp. MH1 TaxID=3242490 RepID=UPI0035200903